jgi:hypothetical protein
MPGTKRRVELATDLERLDRRFATKLTRLTCREKRTK